MRFLALLLCATSLMALPHPFIRPDGARLILVIPATTDTWSLYYSTEVNTNWVIYLSKHNGEKLDTLELDLGLGDARQFWYIGPLANCLPPSNPLGASARAATANYVTYPPLPPALVNPQPNP